MKRLVSFVSSLVLSLTALLGISIPRAFAATLTWDGGGGDNNWNTAANWSTDTVPVDGDIVVFPHDAPEDSRAAVNDIADLSLAGIQFTGVIPSQEAGYILTGNAIELTGDITSSSDKSVSVSTPITLGASITISGTGLIILSSSTLNVGSNNLTLSSTDSSGGKIINSVIAGSGSIIKTGSSYARLGGANTSFTGNISIEAGELQLLKDSFGTADGATTVNAGALLTVCGNGTSGADFSIAEPLSLTGPSGATATLTIATSCGSGGGEPTPPYPLVTFTGAVTLNTDIEYLGSYMDAKIAGTFNANGHKFTLAAGSTGSIDFPGGSAAPEVTTTTYSGNEPNTNINVTSNNIAVVTGTYGDVTVSGSGVLKGVGTVKSISQEGGKVAPGLSPGCLSSGIYTTQNGTFEVELGGEALCTGYDQLNVTGTVEIFNTTSLNVVRFNNYKPKKNSSYIIIANDGTDAVTGTLFEGLAEGATFTQDGVVYRISYVGGDGNDVVITALEGPNTGFKRLITGNPFMVVAATVAVAGALFVLTRRFAAAKR